MPVFVVVRVSFCRGVPGSSEVSWRSVVPGFSTCPFKLSLTIQPPLIIPGQFGVSRESQTGREQREAAVFAGYFKLLLQCKSQDHYIRINHYRFMPFAEVQFSL